MNNNPYVKQLENIDLQPDSALVYATLALAYEQRTANLLTYLGHDPAVAIINDGLDPVIRERLGLPEYAPKEVP
jgi:hypothetical protein